MLTHSGEYALRAVLYLAGHPPAGPVQTGEIAAALGTPRNYMGKVLNALVRAGVLESSRGPGGGFTLAAAPAELTLGAVVAPFEPPGPAVKCVLGDECGEAGCVAHDAWGGIAESIRHFFRNTPVAALARRGAGPAASGGSEEASGWQALDGG